MERSDLKKCRRVVVKVGTSTITHKNGKFNIQRMDRLCRELADLHNGGTDVLLVTSGAVGAGMGRMGMTEKPSSLPVKQALAAVGQGLLMQMYEKLFSEYGCTAAQILLTRVGFNDRSRYLNLCNTLHALAELDAIPVINENDTIAVDELKFGDNDTLSALVACAAGADLLIILSDIDGLYDADPRTHPEAKLLHEVSAVSQNIRDNSSTKGSSMSSGGMYTKITAADVVLPAGIPLVIASGSEENVLHRVLSGERLGTLFIPPVERRHARKQWIAANRPFESVTVDSGAAAALTERG
ncbi:MAG: glutamate 5-kinase, partial [Pyramidobacter sp.]|nr:glutamate 5-kinase [Pyramidobacter sp.]